MGSAQGLFLGPLRGDTLDGFREVIGMMMTVDALTRRSWQLAFVGAGKRSATLGSGRVGPVHIRRDYGFRPVSEVDPISR